MARPSRLVTVTLNAAIDKRFELTSLEPYSTMRLGAGEFSAGGKGLNVARVAAQLDVDVTATGFLAGHAGQFIAEEIGKDGVHPDFVWVPGESRSCLNLVDPIGRSTELLEPGFTVDGDDLDRFGAAMDVLAADAGIVALSGSVPRGCPPDTYATLVNRVKASGALAFVDASGSLLSEVLNASPHFIKPNASEAAELVGEQITTPADAGEVALALHRAYQVDQVVISLGGSGAVLATDDGVWWAEAPALPPVNTVGCGDALVAAYAAATLMDGTPAEALTCSVEVSCAAALSQRTGSFRRSDRALVRRHGVKLHALEV
jgi:tagatose 6-phosphate kinase